MEAQADISYLPELTPQLRASFEKICEAVNCGEMNIKNFS